MNCHIDLVCRDLFDRGARKCVLYMKKILSFLLLIMFFSALILYLNPIRKDGIINMIDIRGFIVLIFFCACLMLDIDFVENILETLYKKPIVFIMLLFITIYLFININY